MPFDIGGLELMVLAVVLIVVVGPKDLPGMLRNFGKYVAKARSMAGDFRSQFDEALREAELDDVKTTLDKARALDPTKDIKKAFDPMTKIGQEITRDLNKAAQAPKTGDSDAKIEAPLASGNTDKSPGKSLKSIGKASSASTAGRRKPDAKSSGKPNPVGTANGVAQKSAGKSSRRGAGTIKSSSAAKPSGRPKAKAADAKPASVRKTVQKSAGVEKKS